MTDMITSSSDILRNAPVVTVYTRMYWSHVWTDETWRISCSRLRFGSSPEGSSAVLDVDCGAGWEEGSATFDDFSPLNILGYYVKIVVQRQDGDPLPDPFIWYGVISEDSGVRDGGKYYADLGDFVLLREQQLVAIGLESIFDKVYVDRSFVQSDLVPSDLAVVKRPLTFNDLHKYAGDGNRSVGLVTAPNGQNCYVFEPDLSTAEWWATRDIVEYLVNCFQPLDWDDATLLPVVISDDDAVLPAWDRPKIEVGSGASLRQLLNRLLDRRRLLGWAVAVDETTTPANIQIKILSFVATAISLPSGESQAANADTVSLAFDGALDVRATLTSSDRHQADQVIVRGARKRSCFSLSHEDETLVMDWKAADETAYEDGPAELAGDEAAQQRQIIEWRRRDELRQVYSYFKVPDDWNFEVGNGTGGAPSSSSLGGHNLPIHPDLDDPDEWLYRPGLRFMRTLFQEVHATRTTTGAQDPPPPLAVIEIEDGSYRLIDKLAETSGVIDRGPGKGRSWSASLRMRDDSPGVIVRVSGAQQLVIAETDFDGDVDTDDQPSWLDWHDMIVTVAAELDAHVEAVYPAAEDVAEEDRGDVKRIVVIDVGDAGRADYIVPDTVTGVDGSGDLVRHAGGYVRDDREWMEDLAKYVYDWYGVTRRAFRFEMQQVLDILGVGQMITSIGAGTLAVDVNSVVVGVTYDFRAQSTSVDTAFANLDSGVLLDWFREERRA